MGDFEDTRFWRGFKSSEKPAPQAEASPPLAESLAAAVRPIITDLWQVVPSGKVDVVPFLLRQGHVGTGRTVLDVSRGHGS